MNDTLQSTARKTEQQAVRLAQRLRGAVGQAIVDYRMIEDGDRVMVCLSGGKDSYSLLDILLSLQKSAPVTFEIVAMNLDQKQPGFPEQVLPEYLQRLGVAFHVAEQDTYGVVKRLVPEGKTTCSLCSRLRRGVIYRVAGELGATKVALGHHRDDMLETLFLNMFYGSKMKAMPPKLVSDDGAHIVIRPLAYCKEQDLKEYAKIRAFPIIPCNLCGSQENLQRQVVKDMMREWEKKFPGRLETMFAGLQRVSPSHLLDPQQFDFRNLKTLSDAYLDGDIAFDEEDLSAKLLQLPISKAAENK